MMFVDPDGLRIVVVGGKKKREAVLQLFRDALDEAGAGEAAEALEIKKIDGQFVITAGGANLEDSDNSTVKLIGSAMNVEDNIAVSLTRSSISDYGGARTRSIGTRKDPSLLRIEINPETVQQLILPGTVEGGAMQGASVGR
jgi:hypothetical protein